MKRHTSIKLTLQIVPIYFKTFIYFSQIPFDVDKINQIHSCQELDQESLPDKVALNQFYYNDLGFFTSGH